jgi:Fe-S cluster assembly protein SufB
LQLEVRFDSTKKTRLRAVASEKTEAETYELSEEKRQISEMLRNRDYKEKYGWKTIIEYDTFPKGLDEDVVRAISAKKGEPEWLLEFRLRAYRKWLTMAEPRWSDNR